MKHPSLHELLSILGHAQFFSSLPLPRLPQNCAQSSAASLFPRPPTCPYNTSFSLPSNTHTHTCINIILVRGRGYGRLIYLACWSYNSDQIHRAKFNKSTSRQANTSSQLFTSHTFARFPADLALYTEQLFNCPLCRHVGNRPVSSQLTATQQRRGDCVFAPFEANTQVALCEAHQA